jgi:protein phosphatase 4 regulatory subunit 3
MQVIEIKDDTVQRKIHQTYRLQYLKDVVLAGALDDSTFNMLNSFISSNQIDINNHITQDATFLVDLLRPFTPSEGRGFGAGPIPSTNPPAPSNPNMFNPISLSNGRQREQAPSPPPSSSMNPSSTSPPLSSVAATRLDYDSTFSEFR